MNIKGQCLCGTIKFLATLKSLDVHACHCGVCRRQGGGCASMTISLQDRAKIESGEDKLTTFKSSEWGERLFCSNCGTHLFVHAPAFNYFGVSAGALNDDDAEKMVLEAELFIDKKPTFYAFAGERKRLTEEEFLASVSGGSKEE